VPADTRLVAPQSIDRAAAVSETVSYIPVKATTARQPSSNVNGVVATVPRDWNGRQSSGSMEHRSSAAYDTCIAAITRQQVDSLMNARSYHRQPQRTTAATTAATATARNIRQNPTVV